MTGHCFPCTLDKVEWGGRRGVFLVTEVDRVHEVVDVISLIGKAYVHESVPFKVLRPYREEFPFEEL